MHPHLLIEIRFVEVAGLAFICPVQALNSLQPSKLWLLLRQNQTRYRKCTSQFGTIRKRNISVSLAHLAT